MPSIRLGLVVLPLALMTPAPLGARPDPATASAPDRMTPVLARAAARSGQWQAAARLWRELTLANSADAEAWAGLGSALSRTGPPADAVAALARASALSPGRAGIDVDLGRAQLALGNGVAAAAAFQAATLARPGDPRGWTGLGVARDLLGDHIGARAAYARALDIDPLNAAARNNLALSQRLASP